MASSTQGIQTLLEAEKEASKVVAKARQYRIQRLRDARSSAQEEIEALKKQKQAEFAAFEKSQTTSDELTSKADAETEEKLKEVEALAKKNGDLVLEKIIEAVKAVRPKVHQNTVRKAA